MPLPIIQEKPRSRIGKALAIGAGKGGVGKSTVTVQVALELKRRGHRVGLLDGDVYGPSLRQMMKPEVLPSHEDGKLVPAVCAGIPMLSMGFFRTSDQAAAVRAPIANQLARQFIEGAVWGDLDYLLIDLPPGTGDIPMTVAQTIELAGAVMVTTPQEVALLDVAKAITLFRQLEVPVLGVVENMQGVFGKGGGARLAGDANVPFLGGVALDERQCRLHDEGRAAEEKWQAFGPIVDRLLHEIERIV